MMTTTRRARPPRHQRRPRHRPEFDRLEFKLVLSAGLDLGFDPGIRPSDVLNLNTNISPYLSVASADPGDGVVLSEAPRQFTVTFDRLIDPGSLNNDLRIDVQDAEGNWNPLNNDGYTADERVDDSGYSIVATFQGLGDGVYRLVLSGSAGVTGLEDGSSLFPDDQSLGVFTIKSAGLRLEDAPDLGTIGDTTTSLLGALDFSSNPNDYKLFRFEVGAGHHYRFLAEISAQREGSPAQVALSLFDSQGRLINSSSVGRSDAPSDPFFFQGLDEGTYYLGITAKGNAPTVEGGFDPENGSTGIPTPNAVGGMFRLDLVADKADAPVGVKDLFLKYQDPTSQMPTGFTVQFTGLIDADSIGADPSSAVVLVDSLGKSWPITVTGYDEATASLTFAFDKALPANRYFVKVPDGGLTDLAGLHPRAAGQLTNTLGTFEVGHVASNFSRVNIGTLLPSVATAGVTKYLSVPAGGSLDSTMTVIVPGIYTIDSNYLGGKPKVELIDSEGNVHETETVAAPGRGRNFVTLDAGVYTLRITAQPGRASLVDEWVTLKTSLADSLLDNGVGQGPATNLRLISPGAITADSMPTPSPSTPIGGPFGTGTPQGPSGPSTQGIGAATGSIPGESSGSPTNSATTTTQTTTTQTSNTPMGGGSILFALSNTAALGLPSGSSSVGVVGPTASNGSTAIASSSPGLPQGINVGFGESIGKSGDEEAIEAPADEALETVAATNGQLPTTLLTQEATIDSLLADAGRTTRDGSTLDSALTVQPITARLAVQWLSTPGSQETPAAETAETNPDGSPVEESESETDENGDASSSLGVGLIAVAAAHFHGRLGRWFGRSKRQSTASKRLDSGIPTPQGPHQPRRS